MPWGLTDKSFLLDHQLLLFWALLRGQEFQFVFLNIEPVWGGNYLVHDSADGWKSRGHNDSWTNAMGIDIALATWQAANWLLNGFWISSRHVTLLWIVVNKYLPSWHTRISLDHKVTQKFGPKTHIWHDFFPVNFENGNSNIWVKVCLLYSFLRWTDVA